MGKLYKLLASLCLAALLVTPAVPDPGADSTRIQVCWTNCAGPGFDA